MKQNKISKRNTVFSTTFSGWNLNLHVIEAEHKTYIIDTGLGSENVNEILAYLKEKDNNKPLYIINTHSHWDHVWGNHIVKDNPILSSKLCYEELVESWDSAYERFKENQQGDVEKALPNTFIEEPLYFEEDGIYIFPCTGHSEDGISIYDEVDKVLNVGDNIGDDMENLLPDLDVSLSEYAKSIEKYLSFDFDYCISGHNQVVKRDTLLKIQSIVKDEINKETK